MTASSDLIPVMIVTGFLGAGKTSVINHILSADHGIRIGVLVNDFGAVNIDAELLVDTGAEDVVTLSNGCICCTLRGDLPGAVARLLDAAEKPDYLVIETSGVSDPIDVVLTLRTVPPIRIDSVVTVVDAALVGDAYREFKPLVMNQIGTADLVLLNKVDLADSGQLAHARSVIYSISKRAQIVETVRGRVPMSVLLGQGRFDPAAIPAHDHDQHAHHDEDFQTLSWSAEQPVARKALLKAVAAMQPGLLRAKGFVYLDEPGTPRAVLHVVGGRLELLPDERRPAAPGHSSRIVMIARQGQMRQDEALARLDRCVKGRAPEGAAVVVRRLFARFIDRLSRNRYK